MAVPPLLCGNPTAASGNDHRAFLSFDLRPLGSMPVSRATLRLFVRQGAAGGDRYGSCTLWHVDLPGAAAPAWDAAVTAGPLAHVSAPADPRNVWVDVEVTPLVQQAATSGRLVFALRSSEGFTATARFFDAPGQECPPALVVRQEP